jgi:NTP pyrophosphatase (non-canonical NTP hydrolase)
VNHYGPEAQLDQLVEEMGELIVAKSHFGRDRIHFKYLLEEVADVYIMLQQFRCIYNVTEAQMKEAIRKKMVKLQARMEV